MLGKKSGNAGEKGRTGQCEVEDQSKGHGRPTFRRVSASTTSMKNELKDGNDEDANPHWWRISDEGWADERYISHHLYVLHPRFVAPADERRLLRLRRGYPRRTSTVKDDLDKFLPEMAEQVKLFCRRIVRAVCERRFRETWDKWDEERKRAKRRPRRKRPPKRRSARRGELGRA